MHGRYHDIPMHFIVSQYGQKYRIGTEYRDIAQPYSIVVP